jgi:hypothetical protein
MQRFDSEPSSHVLLDIVALFVAAAALHAALGFGNQVLQAGGLLDTDAYMRLIRVEELAATGDWYQTVTQKLGAPDGLSLHWTRPLDILILLPSIILSWCGLDPTRAIYWVGVVIAPILHFLACIGVAWAARPLFPQHGAWRLAALMLLLSGSALSYSLAGRPDHHPLCILTIALSAGYVIRALQNPERKRAAVLAGVWGGAGVWVAPEIILTIAPALAVAGLLWLLAKDGRLWAMLGYRFGLGMAGVILAAIVIEQPPHHWLNAEYDKVSILYLAMAIAVVATFRIAASISWSGWRRVTAGLILAATSFAILEVLFPRFYLGSLGNIDAAAVAIFIQEVSEMQPLWPRNVKDLTQFFWTIGNALAAIPAGAYFLWTSRRGPNFAALLYLSIGFALTFAAAMLHLRLATSASVFGAILGCGLFAMICQLAVGRSHLAMLAMRLAGYVVVAFGLQIAGMIDLSGKETANKRKCEPLAVATWLRDHQLELAQPASIILTDTIDSPPAIAYLTDFRLVGGPYHRGNANVADMIAVMTSTNDEEARDIVRRREVDMVLICTTFALRPIRESATDSMYHRLVRGDGPAWLTPVPMPPEAEESYRLFGVED